MWDSVRRWAHSIWTATGFGNATAASQGVELQQVAGLVDAVSRVLQAPAPLPPTGLVRPRAWVLAMCAVSCPQPAEVAANPRFWPKSVWLQLAVAMMLAGTVLGLVGGHVVLAAQQSMPGQPLYFVKRHIEHVQYSGAEEPDVRVALGLAFLGERVAEVQALVAQGVPIEFEVVVAAQQYSTQVLQAAAQLPQQQMLTSLGYITLQTKAYLEVLESLEASASAATAGGLRQVIFTYRRLEALACLAQREPEAFREAYTSGRPELFLLPQEQPLLGPPREAMEHTER